MSLSPPIELPPLWTNETTSEWVDETIFFYTAAYQNSQIPQRVSFRQLCANWNWAKRSDVYTHLLHRYPAKLIPYIPIFLLSGSLAAKGPVLDPFAGTGTVALESILHTTNPKDALLIEINPLARMISSAKTTPLDPATLKEIASALLHTCKTKQRETFKGPGFPSINFWFREEAIIGLTNIKDAINDLKADMHIKDFFWACFSSIIRDMSKADPKVSPPVILSADKFEGIYKQKVLETLKRKNQFNAIDLFESTINKNITRMKQLWRKWQLSQKRVQIIGHDARRLTKSPYLGKGLLDLDKEVTMPNESIGMVITSPPYINAQKYTRTTKFELWWLELIESTDEALKVFDQTLIGTERVFFEEYSDIKLVGNTIADKYIEHIYARDRHKAGILSRYFIDMRTSLREIRRVLKPNGYCALVVGNNVVAKTTIPNDQILAGIAQEEGFKVSTVLVDEIRSRGLITKRHETAGIIADEWVILLQKPASRSKS